MLFVDSQVVYQVDFSNIFERIEFLGTTHVDPYSIERVKKRIEEVKPSLIALELDPIRFNLLLNPPDPNIPISSIGSKNIVEAIFALLIAILESQLGKKMGVAPGDEMLAAIKVAQKEGIKIALIDRRIDETIQRMFEYMNKKEKIFFLIEMFKAFLGLGITFPFSFSELNSTTVIKLTKEFKRRFPGMYRALVFERDLLMADKILNLLKSTKGKIIVVCGAGHVRGIKRNLKILSKRREVLAH